MLQKYEGPLGCFEYNPNEFIITERNDSLILKYIGSNTDGSQIHIPP